MIKQILKDNLFNSIGLPNIAKFKNDGRWIKKYISEDVYNEIINSTAFLISPKFTERVYCILNDITSIKLCKHCNTNKLHFSAITTGYLSMCKPCVGVFRCISDKDKRKTSLIENRIEQLKTLQLLLIEDNNCKVDCTEFINHFISKNYKVSFDYIHTNIDQMRSLFNQTKFIPLQQQITTIDELYLNIRAWHILNRVFEIPSCKKCGKVFSFINSKIGYRTLCISCDGIPNRIKTTANKIDNTIQDSKFILLSEYTGRNNPVLIKCTTCEHEFNFVFRNGSNFDFRCPSCTPFKSKPEYEIKDFIETYNIKCEHSNRYYTQGRSFHELDLYLPEYNLGIEYNGLYWHSETNDKDKGYHINKTNYLKSKTINLIHVFEDEYMFKRDIVNSIILSKCGKYETRIYARKCKIMELSSKQKSEFLKENHIQGNCNSKINIGLIYEDKLVSIMTFGKRKITGAKESSWELMRFCNLLNIQVIGGASKLLSYFKNNHLLYNEELISYADKRFYFSDFYEQLGFTHSHTSEPNYWYTKGHQRFHRSNFQKHKLKNILKNYDDTLTEKVNMTNNGYHIVWDCGCEVYKYKHDKNQSNIL